MSLFQRFRKYVLTETAPARATWGIRRYLQLDYEGAARLLARALADRPGMEMLPLIRAYGVLSRIRTGDEGLISELDSVRERLIADEGRDGHLQSAAIAEINRLLADRGP